MSCFEKIVLDPLFDLKFEREVCLAFQMLPVEEFHDFMSAMAMMPMASF